MKRLFTLSVITALLAAVAIAQTTTVTDTITGPDGSHPSGTCSFQTARRFVSGNGLNVVGVPTVVSFTAGALSVALVPTDTAISAGTLFYQKTCRAPLQTTSGVNCEGNQTLINNGVCTVGPFTWGPTYLQVPVSSSPVAMTSIESDAVPPPINAQWRGAWSAAATYRVGDMVSCNAAAPCGSVAPGTYISAAYANAGHSPPDSPSWWTPIAVANTGSGLPANTAADQVLITSAPSVAGWVSVADCTAAGRILRYSTSAHAYTCPPLTPNDIPDISGLYERANANIQGHIARTDNPHGTTAPQLGLGLVDNTADADKPISTVVAAALGLKAPLFSPVFTGQPQIGDLTLMQHSHQTTPGGGALDAAAIGSGTFNALRIPDLSGTYEHANANIQSHIARTDNPHSVTKAQIGLGLVDNTSDLNKPVSTAQQSALDALSASEQALLNLKPGTTTTGDATKIAGLFASLLTKSSGTYCIQVDGSGNYSITNAGCPGSGGGGGGGALSWAALTNTDWTTMTNTQWTTMAN